MSEPHPAPPARRSRVGMVAAGLAVAAGGALIWFGDPTTPGGPFLPCPSKVLFGITCPGCGGTRAAYSLMHADIGAALHYNALAVIALVAVVVGVAVYAIRRWRGRTTSFDWLRSPVALWSFGITFIAWLVIRNLPWEPFRSLRV